MKKMIVVISLVLLSTVACKKTEEAVTGEADATTAVSTTEIAGTTAAGDLNPVAAQSYIDDVTIGHEIGADGMIPAGKTGDDFKPGDTIHLTMKTKDAPVGSAVKVIWYGPGETKIGEEQKNAPAGASFVAFKTTGTKKWAKGDYRAEVWIGDEKVNTQQFQIVDATKAGK